MFTLLPHAVDGLLPDEKKIKNFITDRLKSYYVDRQTGIEHIGGTCYYEIVVSCEV